MIEPVEAKRFLRATMLADRAHRDPAGAGVLAAGHAPPDLKRFCTVAGYRPIRGEIDPAPLMTGLAAAGATLCLPAARPGQALTFRRWAPGEPLVSGGLGVEEPQDDAPLVTPDLIIVPLAAFDAAGNRLGYGAGFFDRTLEALRLSAPVFALGLAYADHEVAAIPVEPHDQKLDAILTEKGYRACP
jgi:5-formyltetrahydrofolate cyclo-ligase